MEHDEGVIFKNKQSQALSLKVWSWYHLNKNYLEAMLK